jgi:lysophospholipase L1-like esterase
MSEKVCLVLIGDSDIFRWPNELLPTIHEKLVGDDMIVNQSRSGALLQDLPKQAETAINILISKFGDSQISTPTSTELVILACAGENDVSSNFSLDPILQAFEEFVRIIFTSLISDDITMRHLIFLGPKLEPWLKHDMHSRKSYFKLSKSLDRACKRLQSSICNNLCSDGGDIGEKKYMTSFVDCLTLFCGETANLPGAVMGGNAVAQNHYFYDDGLHLSPEGYQIWKELIEKMLNAN